MKGKCIGQDSNDCRQFYLEKVSNNNLTNLKLLTSDEFFFNLTQQIKLEETEKQFQA